LARGAGEKPYGFVGECNLNTAIGEIINHKHYHTLPSLRTRHCEGVGDCTKKLEKTLSSGDPSGGSGRSGALAGVVFAIDLEDPTRGRPLHLMVARAIERCQEPHGIPCRLPRGSEPLVEGHICSPRGRGPRVAVILYRGGPENVYERLTGRTINDETRRILKSRRIFRYVKVCAGGDSRVVCDILVRLAEVTGECLRRLLGGWGQQRLPARG